MFDLRSIIFAKLGFGAVLLITLSGDACNAQQMSSMSGMDMSDKNKMSDMPDMRSMGPSMAAMVGHMYVTPLRPMQPGDQERAKAVVTEVKKTMERYRDYRKALADGYVIANPKLEQPQYHFNNESNASEADLHFNPAKPTSLLYRRTPYKQYKLEGVMYTARPNASEDQLNERIPLSIARWHEHINFCEAPADRIRDYQAAHPRFGMFGSIHTREACEAEGGIFHPYMFTWMVHVFPYESDFSDVFSMNDDVAHVH